MSQNAELINKDQTEEDPLNKLLDGITGFFTSDKKDYAHSANRMLKSLFAHDFFFQLKKEWDFYCQKGKIDLDYSSSKPYMNSLGELLEYLDSNIPNSEVALTLKKLFFIPAFNEIYGEDKLIALEYMRIIKSLSSGELIVLFTTYKCIGDSLKGTNIKLWLGHIAEKSYLKYPDLVDIYEKKLVSMNLLTKRNYGDGSGITLGNYFRLSDLGYNLCKYIEKYDEYIKGANVVSASEQEGARDFT